MPKTAGIILCGGESQRMGVPKWALPLGPETMLDRIARVLSEVVDLLIVVGSAEGELPTVVTAVSARPGLRSSMPPIRWTRDRTAGRGPLEGLAVGLREAQLHGVGQVVATACDTPLISPAFVRLLLDRLHGHDAAAVRGARGEHPLPAAYGTQLLNALEAAIAAGERRAGRLAKLGDTRWLSEAEVAAVDPRLPSLRNINTPDEYAALLAEFDPSK